MKAAHCASKHMRFDQLTIAMCCVWDELAVSMHSSEHTAEESTSLVLCHMCVCSVHWVEEHIKGRGMLSTSLRTHTRTNPQPQTK